MYEPYITIDRHDAQYLTDPNTDTWLFCVNTFFAGKNAQYHGSHFNALAGHLCRNKNDHRCICCTADDNEAYIIEWLYKEDAFHTMASRRGQQGAILESWADTPLQALIQVRELVAKYDKEQGDE